MEPLVVSALAVFLLALWVLAAVRHHRRRTGAAAEWEAAASRPDLWTSGARCAACGARGGLLELDGDAVTFVCLACGARAPRDTRT